MKKLTQCLLSTLTAGSILCSGLVQPVVAETIHDDEPYANRSFVIDKIMFDQNEIGVHYTGIGTETKTNYLNMFWADFEGITEVEADALMAEAGTTTPEGMTNFFQKKAELSPNVGPTFFVYRYKNQGETSLWDLPGVVYYTTRLADGSFLRGKADYRDCLANPYFVEKKEAGYGSGLYCKLESFGDDRTYYWPYHLELGRLGDTSEPTDPLDEDTKEEEIIDDGGLGGNEDEEPGEEIEDGEGEDQPSGELDDEGGEEPLPDEPRNDEPKVQEIVVPKTPNTGFGPRV